MATFAFVVYGVSAGVIAATPISAIVFGGTALFASQTLVTVGRAIGKCKEEREFARPNLSFPYGFASDTIQDHSCYLYGV